MQKITAYLSDNRAIFLLVSLLVIADRLLLLVNFSFQYTGTDDVIFWQGANDYMNGVFHEPYFYGQNYNFMLEALFAIPFLKAGMPYNYALPLTTSILSLFPFFIISITLFKRGYITEALFFISLPILVPIEYSLLTSMTRGFVSGLFFSGFLIFPLLEPVKKSSWIIAALSLSLGFIFNPNSLVFTLSVCLYLLLNNYRSPLFYLVTVVAIIPALSIEFFAKQFYTTHPDHRLHVMWDMTFSFNTLLKNLERLDVFYKYFTPVLWSFGWLILVVIIIAGIWLIKKDWKKSICVLAGILFIIFTLGINKVNDEHGHIFLSATRMYLGIPLLTGLVFLWSRGNISFTDSFLKRGLAIAIIITFSIKMSIFPAVIAYHTKTTNHGAVAVMKMKDLCTDCAAIGKKATENNVNLLIFVPHHGQHITTSIFYSYACPLLEEKFPQTLLNTYDRRTWVYLKEKDAVATNSMICGSAITDSILREKNVDFEVIPSIYDLVLIKNNVLPTDSLLKVLNIDSKRHTY